MVERRRSAVRTAVVWEALEAALAAAPQAPLRVVDLGGGTGGIAVRIAALGHDVTVVDPSPDALASLERRAAEAGVASQVRGVLGDADDLASVVEPATVDLLVCHGVLELVDDPAATLAAAARSVAPGGLLSVLAFQRSAAVVFRALAGHLAEARTVLATSADQPPPRHFSREELAGVVTDAGFTVEDVRGVRFVTDHLGSTVVEGDPTAVDQLLELERAASTDPELMPVATQLHLFARR